MKFTPVFTITEAASLKEAAKTQFSAVLHFHDACGGQSFSLDAPASPALRDFIAGFAAEKGGCVLFDDDGLSFRIVHSD